MLELVTTSALIDESYVDRLERHSHLVKQAATDLGHPAYIKIRQELERSEAPVGFSACPPGERVPRNAPCPCGSGKKYKQYCMWRDRQAR